MYTVCGLQYRYPQKLLYMPCPGTKVNIPKYGFQSQPEFDQAPPRQLWARAAERLAIAKYSPRRLAHLNNASPVS